MGTLKPARLYAQGRRQLPTGQGAGRAPELVAQALTLPLTPIPGPSPDSPCLSVTEVGGRGCWRLWPGQAGG